MELSKLRNYLDQEIMDLEQRCNNIEHMFEKQSYQINEIENKIRTIEENFDFAYEAFSPISQKYDKTQDEIETLRGEQEDLKQNQEQLKVQINFLRNKREEAKIAKQQLVQEENLNEERIRDIEEKYSRILGIQIIERQEQERQRIARDLHDTTVQNLTAMIHKLEFCQQIMDVDSIRAKLEMQLMINTIRESVDDMRETIYNLRPMSFDDIGFEETLKRAIERLRKNTDIKIDLSIHGDVYHMSPAYELTILRIIQEATNNSKKYSNAERVEITLTYEDDRISLNIRDNGNGFDVNEKKTEQQNSGFGISMMKERVYLLKGQIRFRSEKGEGTEIEVILPNKKLEDADEDKNNVG